MTPVLAPELEIPGVEDVVAGAKRHSSNPNGDQTMVLNMGPQHPSTHGVLRLVLDTSADLAGANGDVAAAARDADRLMIFNSARALRWSSGAFTSSAAPPALLHSLADGQAAPVSFSDGAWVVVRPIKARAGVSVLGWVVGVRAVLPRVLGATSQALPRQQLGSMTPAPPGATPRVAVESNRVVIRDVTGRAVWAVMLNRPVYGTAQALSGVVCIFAIAALTGVAVRRYLRHQKSVDARYKALIDQANDGVLIVDARSLQVLYSNPALLSLLDYSEEEARALRLTDIFADGTAPDSLLNRLRDSTSRMAMNLQQRCKNGTLIDAEVRCNALDVDGRAVLAYVTHDVSLRRKAEQQLRENQQRLDRMAHHDQLTDLPNRHYLATFLP